MQSSVYKYLASAGANQIVTAKPAKLMGILVGKDVTSSQIDIGDNATSGTTNVVAHFEGSTISTQLNGGIMFGEGIDCNAGITVTLTAQTFVTILYQPVGNS